MTEPNAYQRTQALAREVFEGLFPHDETLNKNAWERQPIPKSLRLPRVTPDCIFRVGDLIAYQNGDHSHGWERLTAREYVTMQTPLDYGVVEKVTAKTLTVRVLRHPLYSWDSDLGNWVHGEGPIERLSRAARSRVLFQVGRVNEVQAKIHDHPRFIEWQAARAEAETLGEAAVRDWQAARELALAAIRPYAKAAATLNTAVDGQAVQARDSYTKVIDFQPGWDFLTHLDRGTVYLHGLAAMGRIDRRDLEDAVEALRLLNAAKGLTADQLADQTVTDTP